MKTGGILTGSVVLLVAITAMTWAQRTHASAPTIYSINVPSVYPVNKCVGSKMKTAAYYCRTVLKAWGRWDKVQDVAKRDAALAKAAEKLATRWAAAEATAVAKGADCAETTLSASDLKLMVDSETTAVLTQINSGLDLGNTDQAACGSRLLRVCEEIGCKAGVERGQMM